MATTMAAKTLKLKRQRRLFPKQYQANYIPVGRGPNQEVMAGYKERKRGLAFDQDFLNFLDIHARFKNKPPGKVEVEAAIKRISEYIPQMMFFTVIKSPVHWVKCFFNSEHTCFMIMQEDYLHSRVRTSITYGDKDRVLKAWNMSRVRWVEVKTINLSNPSAEAVAPPLRTG